MMNKLLVKQVSFLLVTLLLMSSCSPTMKVTGSWVNQEKIADKTYAKIFIIALSEKFEYKTQVEMDLAFAAVDRGLNVVKSTDIFPYTFSKDNIPDKELLIEKVKNAGCDVVLIIVPVRKESETRYVPGSVAYTPMAYGYYGNFYNYYNYYTPVVYSQGYYDTESHYFLESNLYDLASGDLLWSVQSEATNPANIETFSKQYTQLLVSELKKVTKKK